MATKTRSGRKLKEAGQKGRGKPQTFTQEKFDEILEAISMGRPMTLACRDLGIPHPTFLGWIQVRPELNKDYRLAMQCRAEVMRDECQEIVDDARNDWMEKEVRSGTIEVFNVEAFQRSKLRVEWRMKMAELCEQDRPAPGQRHEDKLADVSQAALDALERIATQKATSEPA